MSEETVMACPECDRAEIRLHGTRGWSGPTGETSRYNCRRCGATFDEPVERVAINPSSGPAHGLARVLWEMDPDDV